MEELESASAKRSLAQQGCGELALIQDAYLGDIATRLSAVSSCLGACQTLLSSGPGAHAVEQKMRAAVASANRELTNVSTLLRSVRGLLQLAGDSIQSPTCNGAIEQSLEILGPLSKSKGFVFTTRLDPTKRSHAATFSLTEMLVVILGQIMTETGQLGRGERELRIQTETRGAQMELTILLTPVPAGLRAQDEASPAPQRAPEELASEQRIAGLAVDIAGRYGIPLQVGRTRHGEVAFVFSIPAVTSSFDNWGSNVQDDRGRCGGRALRAGCAERIG